MSAYTSAGEKIMFITLHHARSGEEYLVNYATIKYIAKGGWSTTEGVIETSLVYFIDGDDAALHVKELRREIVKSIENKEFYRKTRFSGMDWASGLDQNGVRIPPAEKDR